MRRSHFWCLPLAVILFALTTAPAGAAPTHVIKMATLVPDGSVWHKVLLDMGDEWSRGTQGRVVLRLYPGGVAGDEPDMVRKMRIGQLHASALTVKGLTEIDDAFQAFTVPMLFESYDELFAVIDRMEPVLKQKLEAKGFVMLSWGHAGWVYFFTRHELGNLADLKKAKIWVWAGDDRNLQLWKGQGFNPVPLAATDILTGLQTGMIDGLPTVPLGALQLQWYHTAHHMLDLGLAPLVGGLVITKQAWNKIPEADRPKILAACKKAETRLKTIIPEQDKTAIVEMKKRGLEVSHIKPEAAGEWRAQTEKFAAAMRGVVVPPEILDMAIRERDAYRKARH